MGAQSAVILRQVRKAFPLHGGLGLEVLDLEHLALPAGSCTVLRGRSGSGKTTLLNLIAGVTAPFQTFNLLSALSALENVMLAMMFADAVPQRLQRRRRRQRRGDLGL